jgi:glycosyltransferase involved in cell wall biosynthesis
VRGVELDYLESPSIGKELRNELSSADGCICVSHSLKKSLFEAGVDTSKTCVIHNAVDRELFRPQSRTESRRKLRVPLSSALIVSVGNLLSVKRHDVVIKAFAKVITEMPDAHLTIIGGATHELDNPRELIKLCEGLGIQQKVTFAGALSPTEVATWLAAANSFALASDREGCCNALLEALACGIPSVVTSVGDNSYFVTPGENGYLVPVNDSEAFFGSLIRTLNRTSWDKDEISSRLQVGSWNTVASQVLEFMGEQINGISGVNA